MANADEPLGQDVEQEPSDELVRGQPHHLGTMVVGIILPAEKHLVVLQGHQAGVGNGDAMGIAAQIAKHLLGSAERRNCILPIIKVVTLSFTIRTTRSMGSVPWCVRSKSTMA